MTIGICILLSLLYYYLSWVEGGYDVVISIRPDGGIGLVGKLRNENEHFCSINLHDYSIRRTPHKFVE